MPSKARTALPRRPPAVETPAVIGHGGQAADGQLTPHDVADLINRGKLTVADGDALMAELGQRRLKHARPATLAMPIAVPVHADTRPAAAMAHLDDALQSGRRDDVEHAARHRRIRHRRAQRPHSLASRPSSDGGDVTLVRANVLLTHPRPYATERPN